MKAPLLPGTKSERRSLPSCVAGFTLTEILIALAIVGILAAVALPSYQQSLLRAARTDGKNALMQAASEQERFYSNSFSYSTNAHPLSSPPAATFSSPDSKYVISVAACSGGTIATCFVATATPQGGQTDDSCGTLSITNTGLRSASGGTVEACWQR